MSNEYRQAPPASLNIKLLTPKPHLSLEFIYWQACIQEHVHACTLPQHPQASTVRAVLLSQQSKVNHMGWKKANRLLMLIFSEPQQCEQNKNGLDRGKITHIVTRQHHKDGHVLMFVHLSKWQNFFFKFGFPCYFCTCNQFSICS